MAVSLAVYPETFDLGDFPAWLRNFECCAGANGWSDADKLKKLPAFFVARPPLISILWRMIKEILMSI